MALRANFSKSWLRRYLWIAGICLAGVGWCLYDALVAYPQKLEVARAYESLQREHGASAGLEKRWRELTESRGWSDETPKKAKQIEYDIGIQWLMAGIALLIGLPAVVAYLRCRGAWIEAHETGVRTSWGQTLEFGQVQQLDKSRWQKKGIATAIYEVGGARRRFVFDDFKFERKPIGEMLERLEQGLTPEQIIGGASQAT